MAGVFGHEPGCEFVCLNGPVVMTAFPECKALPLPGNSIEESMHSIGWKELVAIDVHHEQLHIAEVGSCVQKQVFEGWVVRRSASRADGERAPVVVPTEPGSTPTAALSPGLR
jgi:hypothetical protein